MRYCTECGQPLGDEDQFCTHCGAIQESADSSSAAGGSAESSSAESTQNAETNQPPQQSSRSTSKPAHRPPRKPMKKRTKILLGSAAALIVILFGVHKGLQAYFDPMDDLQAMDEAAASDDAEAFASHIDFADDSLLDKEAFLSYMKANEWDSAKQQYQQLIEEEGDLTSDITDRNGHTLFTVQPEDHLLGLYQTYSIKAHPSELNMTTPLEDTDITIGDETTDASPDDPGSFSVYPGTYDLKAEASNTYGDFSIEDSLEVTSQNDKEMNLEFSESTYTFSTNQEDAVLFVNGEETDEKLGDLEELGPIPEDSDVKMHAEWTTSDGDVIKSETVTPDDAQVFGGIPFSFDDDQDDTEKKDDDQDKDDDDTVKATDNKSHKTARDTVLDFRSDYEKALNSKDYSKIKSYIASGSAAASDLKEYIGDLEDKGYDYDFTSNKVQDVETIDEETFEVTSREQFVFTNHRDEKTDYDRIKTYTVTTENNEYEISSIDYDKTDRDEN